MENASKALLMAAGVLLAIIIIGVLTGTLSTVRSFQKTKLTEEEQEQLISYNEEYTKYVGQYMYGTEIMTIINRHNNSFYNKSGYPLKVHIDFITPYTFTNIKKYGDTVVEEPETTQTLDIDTQKTVVSMTSSNLESFRNRAFKCTGIEYDNGRKSKLNKFY